MPPTTVPTTTVTQLLSADDVLGPYVYVFIAAFILAFVFTPVMRSIAIYYNIIDKPDLVRKMHLAPVAYLGGVAVFIGWLGGMAMTQFLRLHVSAPGLDDRVRIPMSIIVAALIVVTLGLWDDVKHISPKLKITGQLLAALVLLASGIGTNITRPFVEAATLRLDVYGGLVTPDSLVTAITLTTSWLLTIGLIVFCCNAANLMDGLDGLCGGVTAIIALGFCLLAVVIARYGSLAIGHPNANELLSMDAVRLIVALALLGAVLGFIPYNFNPASIFMGDTGSMFLGFIVALLIVLLGEQHVKWLLAGMVMFALPVLDTSLAFARRYVAGRPFFSADKHHFHHQLVSRGLSVRQAVLLSYLLTLFFVACAVLLVFLRTRYVVSLYLVLFGSIIVAAYKMGMVHERAVIAQPESLLSKGGNVMTGRLGAMEADKVIEISGDRPVTGG